MPVKININPDWTPERVQYLRDNYRTMLAADIAKTFGVFTRNAVIGKARRLGLQSDHRMRPARRGPKRVLTTTKAKISPRGIIVKREKVMDEIKLKVLRGPITFIDLEPWHCREIVRDKPVMYCGHHKMQGSSYCLEHHSKNHVRMANSRVEKYYGL
jgi:hypothetical protein